MLIRRFPELSPTEDVYHPRRGKKGRINPAIQLFGRRFHKDQTEIEYLVEFLLIFVSPKKLGEKGTSWEIGFPDEATFEKWQSQEPLLYEPSAHLILKLFTFLGSSKLETRHETHKTHYLNILESLKGKIEANPPLSRDQVLNWLEQVLVGFVGVAQTRTWCAHAFLPISPNLIGCEAIWKQTASKRKANLTDWKEAIQHFAFSQHVFLARGGEMLYLQLCNLFRKASEPEILDFEKAMGHEPGTAKALYEYLQSGLTQFLSSVPMVEKLAAWIEHTDKETLELIKKKRPSASCGWCPEESWSEAYFFAYEMRNICDATLDPLEKVEMLKTCCVLQVMRSLCAQAARHWESLADNIKCWGGSHGFAWIVTTPAFSDKHIKQAARRNIIRLQEMIHGALRNPGIIPSMGDNYEIAYKDGDEQGQGLLLKLGKKIGFIVPWTGPGARFVLTESLLRYFVLALIPPGKRMTLHSFKECLFRHYGISVNGEHLNNAIRWTYPNQAFELRSIERDWMEEKLRATGFLIPLSDAISLVHNPFGGTTS